MKAGRDSLVAHEDAFHLFIYLALDSGITCHLIFVLQSLYSLLNPVLKITFFTLASNLSSVRVPQRFLHCALLFYLFDFVCCIYFY